MADRKPKSYSKQRRDILAMVEGHMESCSSDVHMGEEPLLGNEPETASCDELHPDFVASANAVDVDALCLDDDYVAYISTDDDADCDSSHLSSDNSENDEILRERLLKWAVQHNISAMAITDLLKELNPYHPSLPIDSRALLNTPRTLPCKTLADGSSYHHFGITRNILKLFDVNPDDRCFSTDTLKLQVNVDGLPLFKSSGTQIWPILGMLKGSSQERPFTIGIFSGSAKPVDVSGFLHDFIMEVDDLCSSGIILDSKKFDLVVHSFICDTPARALLKNIKAHNGYNACERCTQNGEWRGKMLYPEIDVSIRTDASFRSKQDGAHHKGLSELEKLKIDMVSSFCLDYMHVVCLGVVRRLILLWVRGPLQTRLSASIISQISKQLLDVRVAIPYEFARKPRSLHEVDRWKATEFRQFLLYTGPFVLKPYLGDKMYKHFMLLCVAMHCCLSENLHEHYADYAKELLTLFVQQGAMIYSESEFLVYNVHCLIHLVEDVKVYGPLDGISAFPFENHLHTLKKLVRRPSQPLQQMICRISERELLFTGALKCDIVAKHKHANGPIPEHLARETHVQQFSYLSTKSFVVRLLPSDNCFTFANGDVGAVANIIKHESDYTLMYRPYRHRTSYFTYPLNSSDIGWFLAKEISTQYRSASLHEVVNKCICFRNSSGSYVIVPLAHKLVM